MKFNKLLVILLIFTLATGCGGGGGGSSSNPPPTTLASISVTPTNPSLTKGTTQQFTATGTYSDNSTQNLTTSVTWSSSNSAVASISNTGTATAAAVGTTTIAAASGSISGTATLTVTPATLQSIAVSPTNPSLARGTTVQFTATGTYSDNSTQNLTTSLTWSSSNASVASISNTAGSNGTATAIAAGTTTITAASGSIAGTTTLTVTGGVSRANNVLPITVNGSLCAANSYLNKPCVSVTVCAPGTSDCQTITDILLDTGSYGLRIFKEFLPIALQQAIGNSGLANCVQFGDGSSLWGAVKTASVILGNEPAVAVPIQAVSSTFGTTNLPNACSNARPTPAAAGFSGILGVGLLVQDCGATCVNSANNGMYYSCNGSTCSGSTISLASQVQNPVALLPTDNNGVILQLPSVPLGGAPVVDGNLVLGIDTRSNNASSGATAYAASQSARFTTQINDNGNLAANTYSSFIDSGSNGLFFTPLAGSPLAGLLQPNCAGAAWFCPTSTTSISATNTSSSGSPSGRLLFQIGDANTLFQSGNKVFVEIGGNFRGSFDWGLPFFFGRNVYVGFEGSKSSLGTGPYWAY